MSKSLSSSSMTTKLFWVKKSSWNGHKPVSMLRSKMKKVLMRDLKQCIFLWLTNSENLSINQWCRNLFSIRLTMKIKKILMRRLENLNLKMRKFYMIYKSLICDQHKWMRMIFWRISQMKRVTKIKLRISVIIGGT